MAKRRRSQPYTCQHDSVYGWFSRWLQLVTEPDRTSRITAQEIQARFHEFTSETGVDWLIARANRVAVGRFMGCVREERVDWRLAKCLSVRPIAWDGIRWRAETPTVEELVVIVTEDLRAATPVIRRPEPSPEVIESLKRAQRFAEDEAIARTSQGIVF